MRHHFPKKKTKKDRVQPDNATYALADAKVTNPVTGTTIPTEAGVDEAKNWVEHNQK
ncbi:MAG: DUF3787 domain-containing protein [Oscillospiraceae bacterium]|nr:DUF3787 domain-containing protein [Oscillospiraceae bacterium]